MTTQPEKDQPAMPTRGDLNRLAMTYLMLSALSLIAWAGSDIINRSLFESQLNTDKIKAVFLIAFVFFLGMSYAFQRKAKITLFLDVPKEDKLSLGADDNPSRKYVEDVFKNDEPTEDTTKNP